MSHNFEEPIQGTAHLEMSPPNEAAHGPTKGGGISDPRPAVVRRQATTLHTGRVPFGGFDTLTAGRAQGDLPGQIRIESCEAARAG